MRIAYFNGTMVEGQDGVTRTLFKIVDFLKDKNIEGKFYSPIFNANTKEQINIQKVESIKFPFYKDYHLPLPNKKKLANNLESFSPDLLHIHSPCPLGKFAVEWGNKNKIPVYATYHTHFPSYSKYYKLASFEKIGWNYLRNLYNSCDNVFVPTRSIIQELEFQNFKNLIYLPNGIDLNNFNKSYYNPNWKKEIGVEGKKVLLYVGRLVWEKDLRILIEADRILKKKRDDYMFVFVGDGPAQSELKSKIENSIFLGRLAGRELSEAFASSDAFVFPSTTETFGIVILEAMASELPAICVAKNGPIDLIQDMETGILAKPDNPQDFSNKIEMMIDNDSLSSQIRINASKFAKDFTWEIILKKMFELYNYPKNLN